MEDPLIGYQLANFKIERLLGQGGMAKVYYGQDIKLKRPVAIKMIDNRHQKKSSYAERFVREAQSVATWRHENIIQIYYADDEDGLFYFVMEYIDGLDLAHILAKQVASGQLMHHNEVLRITKAIASALDYAHDKGVIHRDVKPANIMIAKDGRIVLTDFGLAMDMEQGTRGEVFGSAHYIAPEQARSSADAVPQSDIYSLGIVLYEMVTGTLPFDDPSSTSVALKHVMEPPPPPRKVNPNISPKLEAVILKALSKSPTDRYQHGRDLVAALTKTFQGEQTVMSGQAENQPLSAMLLSVDELIGEKLDEYKLEEMLGRGGMACVYRGVDMRLKRSVAIKVIDTPLRNEGDYATRFEREAQAIAQLEHGNIVRLYRYGEARGLLYMAMQYIKGGDLGKLLAQYKAKKQLIEPERALQIIKEVALALDYAHERGIIHRDIKPTNIMLDKNGRAYVTDFGLALLTEVGTRGEIFGSPQYIAPEQAISSAGAVAQSDIYALGIILYEMFTGQRPFEAKEPLELALQHMSTPPPPPSQKNSNISPELETVILKTLVKDPVDRYQTGQALVTDLEQALNLAPPTIPTETPPPIEESDKENPEAMPSLLFPAEVTKPSTSNTQLKPVPEQATADTQPESKPLIATKKTESATASATVPSATVAVTKPSASKTPPSKKSSSNGFPIIGIIGAVVVGLIIIVLLALFVFNGGDNTNGSGQDVASDNATQTALAIVPTATLTKVPTATPTETVIPPTNTAESLLPPPVAAATDTPTSEATPTEIPTETPTPLPAETATNTPIPTIANALGQFSGTQGANGWEYLFTQGRESGNWQPMQFDGTCWRPNIEPTARICGNGSIHPGIEGDIAWRWESNVSRTIYVYLTAFKLDTNGGDGVDILVYRNTDVISSLPLAGGDSNGYRAREIQIDVSTGDLIFFAVKVGQAGDPSNDETYLQVQIY